MAVAEQKRTMRNETSPKASTQSPRRRPRRRWPYVVALAIPALLWLAPVVVAKTPLLGWIVDRAARDLDGSISIGSASLGWFSQPVLRDIDVRGPTDQPLLAVETARGDRPLWALLWNPAELGTLRLDGLRLDLVCDGDRTNLEDALAEYLAASPAAAPSYEVALEVVDGAVLIHDRRGAVGRIENLQLALRLPADATKPIEMKASGQATSNTTNEPAGKSAGKSTGDAASGSFSVDLQLAPSDNLADTLHRATLKTENLPLAPFQPILARLAPQVQASARISTALDLRRDSSAADAGTLVEGRLTVVDLQLTAEPLGKDRIALSRLDVVSRVVWSDHTIRLERLDIESDIGAVKLAGALDTQAKSSGEALASILENGLHVDGQVDLARLARLLPETLRLRHDTRIDSGLLRVVANVRRDGPVTRIDGRLEASQLEATAGSRRLVWPRPILLVLTARHGEDGPVVENLYCSSDFLRLTGGGTPRKMNVRADFDLDKLTGLLSELVELDGLRASGRGWAELDWTHDPSNAFQAGVRLEADNFRLDLPNQPVWADDHLTAAMVASGRIDPVKLWKDSIADGHLETASLDIQATTGDGTDRLTIQLLEPTPYLDGRGAWPVELDLRGDLARWQARAAAWFDTGQWSVDGTCSLQADAVASAESIRILQGNAGVTGLRIRAPGWNIVETSPQVSVSNLQWNRPQRQFSLASATLTAEALSARVENVSLVLPEQGPPAIAGVVHAEGLIQRLQQWTRAGPDEPSCWAEGRFVVDAGFQPPVAPGRGKTEVQFDSTVHNLVVTHSSGNRHQEPSVRFVGRATYDPLDGRVDLAELKLFSSMLGGNLNGRCLWNDGRPDVQLQGQIDYDLAELSSLIRAQTDLDVSLLGSGSSPVSYEGPLSLREGTAQGGLAWTRLDAYGFQVGPGALQAELADGTLRILPLELKVNQGRVLLSPELRSTREKTEIHLPAGLTVDHVRINPRMCAEGLAFVSPLLAGVATAEGRVSVELDGGRLPLGDPRSGEVAGRLVIHSAQVGPGWLIRELATVLGFTSGVQFIRESSIPFRLVDGRVYHQKHEVVLPGLIVATSGWVGLDDSMELLIEISPQADWSGPLNGLALILRNRTIAIPVTGTLSQPKLDLAEVPRLTERFIEDAAVDLLGEGLNALDRLLPPAPE